MAFSLIDDTDGAIPITALTKKQLPAWLEAAPERERNWLRALGFAAEPGKHALVPGEAGRFARVVVGLGDADDTKRTMWALAGLPGELPEGRYRLEAVPDSSDPTSVMYHDIASLPATLSPADISALQALKKTVST